MSGMASRSELDKLSDALKKLVTQHPRAKEWLEFALADPEIPTTMASQEDKDMFLKKVMRLVWPLRPIDCRRTSSGYHADIRLFLAFAEHDRQMLWCENSGWPVEAPILHMHHDGKTMPL